MPQSSIIKTFKLSPSSLGLMDECPRCFWLHHHGKKRPEGIFPSLPSGMDRILKEHFDKFRDKGKLPPELKENKECKELSLFNNPDIMRIWRNNLKGISFQDDKGNILHGAVDNILFNKKNNKLIVLDYKTRGYPLKEDTAAHYQNQLNIYNYLLRKNGYETEDYAFLLFYIPKEVKETGEVVFDTVLVKMKINIDDVEKLWKKALKLLQGPCPKTHTEENKEPCPWCVLLSEE